MEGLSNLDSIVNSPEAEEAFGEQGIFQSEGSQFGHLHGFLLKQAWIEQFQKKLIKHLCISIVT